MKYLKSSFTILIISSLSFIISIVFLNSTFDLFPEGSSSNFDLIKSKYLIMLFLINLILFKSISKIKSLSGDLRASHFLKILIQSLLWTFFIFWSPIISIYWLFKKRVIPIEERLINI